MDKERKTRENSLKVPATNVENMVTDNLFYGLKKTRDTKKE